MLYASDIRGLEYSEVQPQIDVVKLSCRCLCLEGLNGASGCLASLIRNLGTRWRFVVSITSRPLCPLGASPQYAMDRSVEGPQIRCGRYGKHRSGFTHLGFGV
jgi:hypothetical protein